MSKDLGWFGRQRKALWHLRAGGLSQYRDWKNRESKAKVGDTSAKSVPAVTISDVSAPVVAGLVAKPGSWNKFVDTFNSIYWQVDQVFVFLEEFKVVPEFFEKHRVQIFTSQDLDISEGVGKFIALRTLDQGILFPLDAGIIYPPDYVSKMLSYLAVSDYQAVCGVLGIQLPEFPKSLSNGREFRIAEKMSQGGLVSILGTGTIAFDIQNVDLSLDDLLHPGSLEVHFAVHLKRKNIPALVVPRETGWLEQLPQDESRELDGSWLYPGAKETGLDSHWLACSRPWGETDILSRRQALRDDSFLPPAQLVALDAIAETKSATKGTNVNSQSTFAAEMSDARKWVELYGDSVTRYQIYLRLIREGVSNEVIQYALNGLSRIDLAKAVEISRELTKGNAQDVQLLRQHANFCARFLLPDEAKDFFLRAAQVAGTQDRKSTTNILYEYYNCLVRFQEYDEAYFLTTTLRRTHYSEPQFVASLLLIYLSQSKLTCARDLLLDIGNLPATNREDTLRRVIRGLVDSHFSWSFVEEPLISTETVAVCLDSVGVLVGLLKILTVVRDEEGASNVWEALCRNYYEHLAQHPEIVWYYKSNWPKQSNDTNSPPTYDWLDLQEPQREFLTHRNISTLGRGKTSVDKGPLISVILTTFNAELTIDFAIKSILNQSYSNLELIVVDDSSSDGTSRIVQKWVEADSRVSLIENTSNVGPYKSRNIGVGKSTGAFIAIQDADDVSLPHRLQTQLALFTQETQAVLGQHVRVNKHGLLGLENDGSILGHGPVTLLVRRQALSEVGLFAEVRTRGDKEFESRLEHFYGSGAVLRVPELLTCALDDGGTNSKRETSSLEKKRDLLIFKQRYTLNHSAGCFDCSDNVVPL